MEALEREIEVYQTEQGRRPFQEWLEGLVDVQARAKIRARIDRIALGNFGHCEPVGAGVSELKVDFGPGYRIYFGQIGRRVVVLLCGGDKSNQRGDIASAQAYWADYRSRRGQA